MGFQQSAHEAAMYRRAVDALSCSSASTSTT
jgi:hypothetical protein